MIGNYSAIDDIDMGLENVHCATRVLAMGDIDQDFLDAEEDETEGIEACPMCGEMNYPLGALGRLAHFSCRACGMSYSVKL